MKQNDFYEVDGCTEFIPVTVNETYTDGVDVTVRSTTHPFRITVKQVYQFLKPHEPQKVVVSKVVAGWYERNKDDINTAIYSAITGTYRKVNGENDDLLDTFEGWLVYEDNSILILVQMYLFGYEIEQEKLYTVEIPNPALDNLEFVIVLKRIRGRVCLVNTYDYMGRELSDEYKLTEAEIKQDFEWAWQFAKEVEEDK
ncbi:DUF1642 domain-containing protein [Streptococcus suis]|uniref:DUF1642 domain-containing protein n=1 Tax=Streptococcus suis TaxID=1307 RepID=UPI000CF68991|nr:DUF1642 domain-containing protein [Streptococcus suis]